MNTNKVDEWWGALTLKEKIAIYNRDTLPYTSDDGIYHDIFGHHWDGNTQVNIDGGHTLSKSSDLVTRMIRPIE